MTTSARCSRRWPTARRSPRRRRPCTCRRAPPNAEWRPLGTCSACARRRRPSRSWPVTARDHVGPQHRPRHDRDGRRHRAGGGTPGARARRVLQHAVHGPRARSGLARRRPGRRCAGGARTRAGRADPEAPSGRPRAVAGRSSRRPRGRRCGDPGSRPTHRGPRPWPAIAPARVVLTHPARWGAARLDLLREAGRRAHLPEPVLVPEPLAAAAHLASDLAQPDDLLAVYDLGGGTFDAAVVRRTVSGFEVAGPPGGDETLGGEVLDDRVVGRSADLAPGRHGAGHHDWHRAAVAPGGRRSPPGCPAGQGGAVHRGELHVVPEPARRRRAHAQRFAASRP